ncbi:hypothetical protein GQ53DRAFT_719447 [Thozetella sp. PMI_491]|nr:hypothetical protein GQ53DRAFT_719447 [Thozetella sp. PMI_491]
MPAPRGPSLGTPSDPDGDQKPSGSGSSTARRGFFSRALVFRSLSRHSFQQSVPPAPSQTGRGAFGLTTLYAPSTFGFPDPEHDTDAHVVFVHGLGGGSEHTWLKGSILWPRDLLPGEDAFTNVAIYTFGYDSNFRRSSMVGIYDFAKSLLACVQDDPMILMGGLVIQAAYIIARQLPVFEDLAKRIQAMFFLSTPHHGSNHAETLSAILRLSPGPRPYLEDLKRGSDVVKSILTEFNRYADELHLESFYETKPLHIAGIGKLQVVDKQNAVLGYERRSQLLNGDHRSICKFDSSEDSNFKMIHHALARTINIIRNPAEEAGEYRVSHRLQKLNQYLGVSEPPDDDLFRVVAERVPGTCAWIGDKAVYQDWVGTSQRKILWVRGPPASGKSFVSGSVIEALKEEDANVCYYFFVFGDALKAMISTFLLSIAWQAAAYHPAVERKVLEVCAKDPHMAQAGDYRTIWRKLWLQGILTARCDGTKRTFLVVDALDESRLETDLVRLLVKLSDSGFAKVVVTSRNEPEYYHITSEAISLLDIDMADTQRDIAIYLHQRPSIINERIRAAILQRSNGCFLWAFLVVERLSNCADSSARLRLVEKEPTGMRELYARVVRYISNREDIQRILTWAACATRPLTLEEMAFVMKGQTADISETVRRECHDLLYVDSKERIRIRHSSAREFLLRTSIMDDLAGFAINPKSAHEQLALACLEYLTGLEMKGKQRRKMSTTSSTRSPFISYACSSLYEHLNLASSQNEKIVVSLVEFLTSSNVLAWVEYLSQQNKLEVILATAQTLRDFLQRKSKSKLSFGDELRIVDEWAEDLVKLVSKFGRQLLSHPESIFVLIPPFCPPESAPYKIFAASPNIISVCGLSLTTWDDCLCTISLPERPRKMKAIATSDKTFCIGTSHGRVILYNDKTFLHRNIVNLQQQVPVQMLQFANSKPLLAITNNRNIQVWNTERWEQQWETPISKQFMAMTFIDEDRLLLAALKNNTFLVMNLIDRKLDKVVNWVDKLVEQCGNRVRGKAPMDASFCPEMDLLAIAYRSQDIIVWNYEDDVYSIYNHDSGLSEVLTEPFTSVWAMTFSRLPGTCLLAASYNIGDIVLFDILKGSVKVTISDPGAFGRLTSSPDGRTLAAAANDGTIVLFDFETLRKLYRIKTQEPCITVLSFTGDNTRLLDIRGGGQSCRVWDPMALYRRELTDSSSDSIPSVCSGEIDFSVLDSNEAVPIVTSVVCDETGDVFFVGKDDSSVSVYATMSGLELAVLFSHGTSIMRLHYDTTNSILTSVDTAGCLMVHRIVRTEAQWRADKAFSHRTTVTGVQHFVCDADTSRVLICANDIATIHLVDDAPITIGEVNCESLSQYYWARHPSDPESLLLVSEDVAHIYSWSGLERLTKDEGILLTGALLPELIVRDASSLFDGSLLGITCSGSEAHSRRRLLCYDSSYISNDSASAPQLIECQPLCEDIDHVIGAFHSRLVFLHMNGWVCSVRRDGFTASKDVAFHFMPPADWLRASPESIIIVSQLGDVLFAWKGEVAVVKRGLKRSFQLQDMV